LKTCWDSKLKKLKGENKKGVNKMDFLEKLIGANGVSGSESEIRNLIKKEIKPFVDEIKIDKMGNLICRQKGTKPRVMLAAHMDEIGVMVKSIHADGGIHLSAIGGMKPEILLGQRVLIYGNKKPVPGVITTKDISNDWEISEDSILSIDDLFVDAGCDKKHLKKLGVDIGSPIALQQEPMFLSGKDYLMGKALDDRLGCYILIDVAKKLKNSKNENVFVFTVQEEVGLYGAKTAAFDLNPDWGIAVDVTNANDSHNDKATRLLGGGPTITAKDSDMIASRCINGWLINAAKKNKINIQMEVSDAGTTDALSISLSRGGVPTSVIGVPVRNLHSTVSICHMKDVRDVITVLSTLLKKPPKSCIV
jgi:putative aminopeptidase FrvX